VNVKDECGLAEHEHELEDSLHHEWKKEDIELQNTGYGSVNSSSDAALLFSRLAWNIAVM
jgi:hypothetical protein